MSAMWLLAALVLCLLMGFATKVPTLKHAHVLIVTLRACWLMGREMWDGAMLRRVRWQEVWERAARDV